MKILTTLLLCFSMSLVFVACGDDDCIAFAEEFQPEIDNINAATSTWAQDQTQENCDNLKDAYQDYIDALEDWESCAEELGDESEWQEALEESRDVVDTIC